MEKILVNVFVPILHKDFDVFIPKNAKIHEVLELLNRAVKDLSDGKFLPNENTALCRRADGEVFSINMSVYELGLRNGSKLMLI